MGRFLKSSRIGRSLTLETANRQRGFTEKFAVWIWHLACTESLSGCYTQARRRQSGTTPGDAIDSGTLVLKLTEVTIVECGGGADSAMHDGIWRGAD